MDQNKVNEILENAEKDIESAESIDRINDIRNKYLAKKSELMALMSTLGSLNPEERKTFGQKLNEVRNFIANKIQERNNELAEKALQEKLEKEKIDISLPGKKVELGGRNPFYLVQDEVIEIFTGMGFSVFLVLSMKLVDVTHSTL